MAMSNEEILVPNARSRSGGSGRTSRATFGDPEARGPIIDQDGREIPQESLGAQFNSFRFDCCHSTANPFANLTREQRLARLRTMATGSDGPFLASIRKTRHRLRVI